MKSAATPSRSNAPTSKPPTNPAPTTPTMARTRSPEATCNLCILSREPLVPPQSPPRLLLKWQKNNALVPFLGAIVGDDQQQVVDDRRGRTVGRGHEHTRHRQPRPDAVAGKTHQRIRVMG